MAYAETFRCPGGELCLDFCNTGQGVRGARKEEWIADFGDLLGWLEGAHALTARQATALRAAGKRSADAARDLWARAVRLREALARALLAKAEGRVPAADDLRAIEAEYARTAPCARLVPTADGFAWACEPDADELQAALRPIVESAVSLMTSPRMARLRRCGNLMKVRRHRERHRSA